MSGKVQGYVPFRINFSRCQNGACPIPPSHKALRNAGFFSGNMVTSGFTMTQPFLLSLQAHQAIHHSGAGKQLQRVTFANKDLNAFGRWEGGPGGFGRAPRNNYG
jgi:hypothetical protein